MLGVASFTVKFHSGSRSDRAPAVHGFQSSYLECILEAAETGTLLLDLLLNTSFISEPVDFRH